MTHLFGNEITEKQKQQILDAVAVEDVNRGKCDRHRSRPGHDFGLDLDGLNEDDENPVLQLLRLRPRQRHVHTERGRLSQLGATAKHTQGPETGNVELKEAVWPKRPCLFTT